MGEAKGVQQPALIQALPPAAAWGLSVCGAGPVGWWWGTWAGSGAVVLKEAPVCLASMAVPYGAVRALCAAGP